MRAALIVAGGRSTRFGATDKAIADLAGKPMIRWVADRVETIVDEIVINCRVEQADDMREAVTDVGPPVRFAFDDEPDRGPLAGIHHGLTAVHNARYAFVTACDMPFIDPAVIDQLFELARDTDAAVPRLEDGRLQPTHAVYHVDAMARACDRALRAGEDRIVHAIDRLECTAVSEERIRGRGRLDSFVNVNTRAEFDAAAARLSEEDGG